jgi:RNA polymerase sigma-70 factor (ECF subfamily)
MSNLIVAPALHAPEVLSWREERPRSNRASFHRVQLDESDLIERCKRGDRTAFVALFRAHRGDVARLVHRMVGPVSDVEDLVQEVFLQVYRSIGAFRGSARFSTWLHRVAVNVVLMHRRAAKARPSFTEEGDARPPVDNRLLPDEALVRNARVRAFYRLLDRLSEKKRTVYVLHELEGLPPAEIANLVGAPVLTVRTRLFYARRELLSLTQEEPELAGLPRDLEGRDARGEPA